MVTIRPLSRSLCRPLSRALVWLSNNLGYAQLLVDPTGDDNSVLYTAREAGNAGESISVEYAAPAAQATTTVDVTGDAITVTPGTAARMVIGGILTSDGSTPMTFGDLFYAGISAGKASYSHDGFAINNTGDGINWLNIFNKWIIRKSGDAVFESYDAVATPDLVTTWQTSGPETGTPTVTAGVSSAAQVIAAVNADASAAALVVASESGASTGPVAQVAAANLIYPEVLTLEGLDLTLGGETLTLN